jgi:predicted PurR-regulated permease PerM
MESDSLDGEGHVMVARPKSAQLRTLVRLCGGILALLIVAGLYWAKTLLVPLVIAVLAWLALSPLVRWLMKHGVPAPLSSAVLTLGLVVSLTAAAYVATGPAGEWLSDLPATSAKLRLKLRQLAEPVEAVKKAAKSVEEVSGGLGDDGGERVVVKEAGLLEQITTNLRYVASTAAIATVLLYFMLASGTYFHRRLVATFEHLQDKKRALRTAFEIEQDVSHYLSMVTLINVGLGVAVGVLLAIAGMPASWSWGVTATILNFMPYIGALLGIFLLTIASVITFDSAAYWLLMPSVYLACTFIEGQFITPWLLSRKLNITPVAILTAVAFWAWIWGFVGAVIAVPMLVVVKSIADRTGTMAWLSRFTSNELPPPPRDEPAGEPTTDSA